MRRRDAGGGHPQAKNAHSKTPVAPAKMSNLVIALKKKQRVK
jgi:hypothetical protein